ncbi:MAG TPA: VOC family protein [Virgibacillus sp.]|nr:VOC family protein [Virgibacillus sp.]
MLALDHIVINSSNTNDIITHSGMKVAIKAVKGGEHDEWGTYNYLSHFSNNSYLELLGVNDYEKARNSTNPLIQHLLYMQEQEINGPFQFALRTKQLDSYVTHFDKEGIPYKGPFAAQREKPDGTILKWRMLFPVYDYKQETLPFLIEWEDPKSVFSEANLANTQSITRVNYGSLDKQTFARIYQMKPKKLNKNQLTLLNSTIYFTQNGKINFELV